MNLATRIPKLAIAALTIVAVAVVPIVAQEAWNGLLKTDMASIGATRDVSQSKIIPAPAVPFGGDIKRNASESTAWWPPEIAPPKGALNVLLFLIDDEGFGAPSTFGGDIGVDYSTAVDEQYTVPNKFNGAISQVVFNNTPMKLTAEEKAEFNQQLDAAGRGMQ